MNFGPEMMLGVIAIIKEEPVVDFSVAAHAPGDWFIRIRAVMAIISIQITEAVAQIPERHKIKNHVAPIKEKHREQRDREGSQFEIAPENVAIAALAQFFSNGANVIAKETEKNIAPRTFRLAVVAMPIDRQPIDRVALLVLSIGVSFVMLHVHPVVHRLRETTGDRLGDAEQAIQNPGTEKRIVDKVMANAVDIGIDHQRINKSEN